MVAYSFQSRFQAPIFTGRKTHTVRGIGAKRHARPDEKLQIYTGMRTIACVKWGDALCADVRPIVLNFPVAMITIGRVTHTGAKALDKFAEADGFLDWKDLTAFWAVQHVGVPIFSGLLISWRDFTPTVERAL